MNDKSCVPATLSTVKALFSIAPLPDAKTQRTAESESHSEELHEVLPILTDADTSERPKLVPCMVTVAEPVAGPLRIATTVVAGASYVKEPVLDPIWPFTSITMFKEAPLPELTRHETLVAVAQAEVWHAVFPTYRVALGELTAKLTPNTVKLAPLVKAAFWISLLDITGESYEKAMCMVPITPVTIAAIAFFPPVPNAGTHFTEESAVHTVVMHTVAPK